MNIPHCGRWGLFFLIAAVLTVSGCTRGGQAKKAAEAQGKEHDHGGEGPHGGAIGEGPDETCHAEFLVDHAKKQTTIYILDDKAKNPFPLQTEPITLVLTNVKPPVTVTLKPDPQTSDPSGLCSRFVGTDDKLGVEMEFEGVITGKVKDKPYIWKFAEKEDHHNKK